MDLSKLSIEPRMRSGWQAIDLGFVMARRWWWPCFLVWAIPSFVVFFVLSVLLYRQPWIALAITWWLKPLWDRLPLLVASRLLFGEPPGTRAALKNFIPLAKKDLLAALTYRRFSLSRSFDLPVTVLEGLRKDARRKRLVVLHQGYGKAANMLTLVCTHMGGFISLAFVLGLLWMVPQQLVEGPLLFMFSDSLLLEHATNLVAWMTMALVAPFYCLAGFSLYINRRIQLEGWDIEVRFRHLLARHEKPKKPGRMAACLLPFMMTALMLTPNYSWADAEGNGLVDDYYQQLRSDAADSKAQIVEVLNGPDYVQVETKARWRFKSKDVAEKDKEGWGPFDLFNRWYEMNKSLRKVLKNFAGLFEIAAWLLLAGLIAWVIFKYRHGLAAVLQLRSLASVEKIEPDLLFGLDVREDSLPDDVCRAVEQLWDDGRERQAVALLYRATLSALIHQHSFEFHAGFTEQECVALVARRKQAVLTDYLSQLTRVWQRLAYGHQLPERERVTDLCAAWQGLFAEVGHAA